MRRISPTADTEAPGPKTLIFVADAHKFETSCGNVFADPGLPDADERMAKAQLAHVITQRIKERGLTQTRAADLLGTDQGKISAIMRGRLASFTYDRLLRFLNLLGCNVRIEVEVCASNEAQGKTLTRIT